MIGRAIPLGDQLSRFDGGFIRPWAVRNERLPVTRPAFISSEGPLGGGRESPSCRCRGGVTGRRDAIGRRISREKMSRWGGGLVIDRL
jgi:hypothetical protein